MSDEARKFVENNPFHPTDPPHGLHNFDLGTLSKDQQRKLNELKTRQRIENEVYLAAHPEVRGLVSILLRHLLSEEPKENIHEAVGNFFNRPRRKLITDLLNYFNDNGYSGSIVENLRNEIAKTSDSTSSKSETPYASSFASSESTI